MPVPQAWAGTRKGLPDDVLSKAAVPPSSQWGLAPQRTSGNGLDQTPSKFLAWVRKVVVLYLRLLVLTGDLDTLQKAAAFLYKGLPFAEPACLLDLARWDWTEETTAR